jgi:SAM-dependent methyltransferase
VRAADRREVTGNAQAQGDSPIASSSTDKVFAGSIPKVYDTYLVPLLFAPYAADLASRLAATSPRRVLELAAGTGVVTRALASVLPDGVSIVATDLNQPMLDHAAALGTRRPVQWRQADAMQLPFPDETFDAVVCQCGVMFFPDKRRAFAEARRVLRPGGTLMFNVWDRLEDNEFSDVVTAALASLFPEGPPRFFPRTPHGYHDAVTIETDLRAAGFGARPDVVTVAARSRAATARDAAIALCHGTPLRNEIEARVPSRLEEATNVTADALARRYGGGEIDGKTQAKVVTIQR